MKKAELLEQIVKEEAIVTELEARKYLESLYLFNKYVLQVGKGKGEVELAPFHKELCEFVEHKPEQRKLILLPRGHLKSSLVTVGYSLYRIVKDPNIRILIVNATHEMAKTFLNQIKNHLRRNRHLIKYYGHLTENADKWSETAITIPLEDSFAKKEPTVTVFGVESNWVSQHYDLILLDDLVCRENIGTKDQIDKVITAYRDIVDLADPGTEIIVIGTTWDDSDLYSWIRNPENYAAQNFEVMKREAVTDVEFLETDTGWEIRGGHILWPQRFDREELTRRLNDQGMEHFSAQYLNNPVPPRTATFKKRWFKYFEKEQLKGLHLNRFTYVDPAFTTSKQADYTAIVTVGVDRNDSIYVLEIVREKLDPISLMNELFSVNERQHPREIYIEAVAAQKTIRPFAQEEMKRRGIFLPLKDIKPDFREAKEMRIKKLQPYYATGKIVHSKEVKNTEYLEDELLRFPRGRHDDTIDALAYFPDTVFKPKRKVSRPRRGWLY